MCWKKTLHFFAGLFAALGILALFGAWFVSFRGSQFLWFTEGHLFNDAKTLLLASIALGIGTLIHIHQDKKKK